MAGFKLLIDTNVVIGLEDARPVSKSFAEIVRLSNEHKVDLFVDSANYDDVSRDRDPARRAITLSKLAKFQRLRVIPATSEATLVAKFGPINSENDRSDVRLLAAIEASAADFLVTQDNDLRRRAGRSGLDAKVLTVEEALAAQRGLTVREQASSPRPLPPRCARSPLPAPRGGMTGACCKISLCDESVQNDRAQPMKEPITPEEVSAFHKLLRTDPQRYLRIVNEWIAENPRNSHAYFDRHFAWMDLGEPQRAG